MDRMLRVLVMGLCLPVFGCGASGLNQTVPPDGDVSADLAGTAGSDLSDVADLATPPDLGGAPDLAPTPSCTDRQKDGTETDVDCGGGCAPCGLSKGCI